ncbi:hypothetical protein B0H14DRAFT_3883555 [Mycena olivaceomarginata]|nr:hypothetical protein B0H14DRAFT_3883555 [Mycena olivaceomarginata]
MSSGGPQSLAVSLGYIRASWYGWSSFNGFRSPLRPLVPAHYCDRSENYSGAQRFRPQHGRPFLHCPVATARYPGSRRSFRPPARRARRTAGLRDLPRDTVHAPRTRTPPAAAAPTLRMLPCARRAWRTCARLAGSIFDPLALAAPPPPRIAHLRAHRWVHFCTPIDFRDATQAPRTRSTSPRRCCVDPSRFSGPPSLRIVYPHVSCHMWHAPVRRPPLLRSQPPLARPLRVPTVAPIQRTLARPDPWN